MTNNIVTIREIDQSMMFLTNRMIGTKLQQQLLKSVLTHPDNDMILWPNGIIFTLEQILHDKQ